MKIEVFSDDESTARAAAKFVAAWRLTNFCRSSDAQVFFHQLELSLQNLAH